MNEAGRPDFWAGYFAAGDGEALGAGGAAGAGAGEAAADPEVAGAAAAAACGCAAGLIQQAWTRTSRLRGTLSSIVPPNRVRQRKAAWMCPPGQPKRS